MRKSTLAVGFFVICLLATVAFYAFISKSSQSTKTVSITLTEEGYVPNEITVKKGTRVTFDTTQNSHHWPASDIHPSHSKYPEFDPLEPVPAEESWSFVFGKKGSWHFHDHLQPYYKGTIHVE